jgi:HEAT repeat protein
MRPRYADLFRRMRDPDQVLADAAFDAVLFDRADALPDLVECFQTSRDAKMRFDVVQLLGFTESPLAVPTLVAALDDKDASVRAEACRALEDVRAVVAIPTLEARLTDVDTDVRHAAAEALTSLRATG